MTLLGIECSLPTSVAHAQPLRVSTEIFYIGRYFQNMTKKFLKTRGKILVNYVLVFHW